MSPRNPPLPSSTYRLQLTRDFTFAHATALVDYLQALGVTAIYASPFMTARPGSVHGYDVVDHGTINPEIGSEQDLRALHAALAQRGMSLIMDVVPNHMCVNTNDNQWWNDVLENGPGAPHARFFDIDWHPPKRELTNKVLLPVLGQQFGRVLEDGELKVEERNGAFVVTYFDHRYPVSPSCYGLILEPMVVLLGARPDVPPALLAELESIVTAAGHLPASGETAPRRCASASVRRRWSSPAWRPGWAVTRRRGRRWTRPWRR